MRRRRRRRELHTVSLFPFLAVLICTFGVLIILLVIVVKAADTRATAKRQQQEQTHQEQLNQLQLALELEQIRIDGLMGARPELLKKLRNQKDRQAFLQSEIAKAASELEILNRSLKSTTDNSPAPPADQLRQRLQLLTQQLEDEQDLLQKKRDSLQAQVAEVKYSVVPYSGSHGIQRRPIYIECRKEEIEIQPFGIRLRAADFVQPVLPNNPLDAALIAIREYYLQNDLLKDGEAPYPLLIVRPDGASAYAMARHAIKSWDEEFGYELIESEIDLDFGQSDLQLAQQIKLAVDAARNRQQKFVVQRERHKRNLGSQLHVVSGLQASGNLGGFVNSNGRLDSESPSSQNAPKNFERNPDAETGDTASNATKRPDVEVRGLNNQESLSGKRGKEWALPSKAKGSTAYRRPVRIYLANESMIIESDSNSNRRLEIQFNDNAVQAIDSLVDAIWKRIDSWGVAGVGAHWQPDLDVVVLPGGARRFGQIESLLKNSGLGLKEYQK